MTNFPDRGKGDAAPAKAFAVDLERTPVEGAGDVESGRLTWRTLISGDRTPSNEVVFGVADFPPNGELHLHRHEPAEFYFGLSGDGTVTADGRTLHIAKGVAIFIPGNVEHGVVAGGDGLSIAYGFAKNSYEDIVYRMSDDAAPEAASDPAP
jgi:quercetin dioxygenase-like cupin family protein